MVAGQGKIRRFVSNGVGNGSGYFELEDGSFVGGIDMVVFATGYRQTFPFLKDRQQDANGNHTLPSLRLVVDEQEPCLAFIGFARPNVGAIPPLSEMQIMWWLSFVEGAIALPLRDPAYRLLSTKSEKTTSYGVDHGAYMHQLGRDFGGAPSLGELIRRGEIRACIAYSLGQSFTPFFQICGPYANDCAMEVARNELFETVSKRGLGANIMFTTIAAIFGVVNFGCELIDLLLSAAGVHLLAFKSGHM